MYIREALYKQIIALIPTPCVDLVTENNEGKILLLKRLNDPAKGEWWFPGGRVHYGETREHAGIRKLKEECRLNGKIIKEVATFDLIFSSKGENISKHDVTSVFHMKVRNENVVLDDQSSDHKWLFPGEWFKKDLPIYIRNVINLVYRLKDSTTTLNGINCYYF